MKRYRLLYDFKKKQNESDRSAFRRFYETTFIDFELANRNYWDPFLFERLRMSKKLLKDFKSYTPFLDAGTGFGEIHNGNEPAINTYALDLSYRGLIIARNRTPHKKNIYYIQSDIEFLPFKDSSFPVVICSEVLEHLPNPEKAFSELSRVCKRFALISIPTEASWIWTKLGISTEHRFSKKLQDALGKYLGHMNNYSVLEFKKLVETNGFKIKSINGIFSIIPPPFKLIEPIIDMPLIRSIYKFFVLIDRLICKYTILGQYAIETVFVIEKDKKSNINK